MRIIAGNHRGRNLASLGKGDAAAHLRPTTDRVRESLFSVLGGARVGVSFHALRVLDLFAGTGALGLEALSRGAAHVSFVDSGRKALQLIRANIALLREEDRCQVLARDATRLPAATGAPFDLVFLDPPYGKGLGELALRAALAGGWISDSALVAWEESASRPTPAGFQMLDNRNYGDTYITILRRMP